MKFIYYDKWLEKDGVFEGYGSIVRTDSFLSSDTIKAFRYFLTLDSDEITVNEFYDKILTFSNLLAKGVIYGAAVLRIFEKIVYKIANLIVGNEDKDIKFNEPTFKEIAIEEDDLIKILVSLFGVLGKDSFVSDGENLHCKEFTFDREWFFEEFKKVSKLMGMFDFYNDGLNFWNKNNFKGVMEVKEGGNTHTLYNKKKVLEAINTCMHNVKTVYSIDNSKDAGLKQKQVPMNIFGAMTLEFLDALKKDMAFVTCEECGDVKPMKRESSHICRRCQNASYQRKKNIKEDVKRGLSLEDILAKRKRMDKNEIIKMYNELKKEL